MRATTTMKTVRKFSLRANMVLVRVRAKECGDSTLSHDGAHMWTMCDGDFLEVDDACDDAREMIGPDSVDDAKK